MYKKYYCTRDFDVIINASVLVVLIITKTNFTENETLGGVRT